MKVVHVHSSNHFLQNAPCYCFAELSFHQSTGWKMKDHTAIQCCTCRFRSSCNSAPKLFAGGGIECFGSQTYWRHLRKTCFTHDYKVKGGVVEQRFFSIFCRQPQAGASNDFIVTLPIDSLDEGSTYSFSLRVTTAVGVWGEAQVEVFKASDALPALKVCQKCTSQTCVWIAKYVQN